MRITFVTFHIDAAEANVAVQVHPNAQLRKDEYLWMIDGMFQSARYFHPRSRCVILSNASTDLSSFRGKGYDIVLSEASAKTLMLDRTRAMSNFVADYDFSEPLVFLDSDILLNGSLSPIFNAEFDVALTYREHPKHPINGGLIFLNVRRPEECRRFFERFVREFEQQHAAASGWFGDQDALLQIVGTSRYAARTSDIVDADGIRVALMPCETFNYSPAPQLTAIKTPLKEKLVLHFKGPRKFLMRVFWDAYIAARARPGLGNYVRALRARAMLRDTV